MKKALQKPGLTSYQLKWIAIIAMVIDHIGAVLYPGELPLRVIGRLSFPIFCFLLTEGFCHTHDRRSYMLRLGGFALISEVPYDLTFHGNLLDLDQQNIFFTLLLGVLLLAMLEKSRHWLLKAAEIYLVMWAAEVVLRVDYGYEGILLICIFYLFRGRIWVKTAGCICWNFLWENRLQAFGGFSVIPIMLYNGERGRNMKYFFYIFYPAHLLILHVIDVYCPRSLLL